MATEWAISFAELIPLQLTSSSFNICFKTKQKKGLVPLDLF